MIIKALAPDLIRGGNRFSDRVTLKTAMRPVGLLAVSAVLALTLSMGLGLGLAAAQPASRSPGPTAATGAEPLVENRRVRRGRPAIRVQPRYPHRRYHSAYPLPYDIESPGPHAKRHCVNRYVTEYRVSGPVVVPRMRCWWGPG